MSRTSKFLRGFGLGYLNLVATTVAGIFLTRFYLGHLGQVSFGYWLVASQLLGFAALLDLGVVSILPREIAYITGSGSQGSAGRNREVLLRRVSSLVLLQIPPVFAILLAGWLLLPSAWLPLRWPLAILLAGFVLSFPMRIPTAILTGLQDLSFLSGVQLVTWLLGTILSVALVWSGWGLGALAVGYVASQCSSALCSLLRLRLRYPLFFPKNLTWPDRDSIPYMKSAFWATVSALATLFIFGTESLVVGALFGAATVVPYSSTGKLFSALGNQPTLIMQAAAPGLSEARTATDGPTRLRISVALAQGMLSLTAAIIVVVIAVNQGFVTWWLGPSQYAGLLLTCLFGARLLLRHWNTTLIYTLFSFGHERLIALVTLADGALTVLASTILAKQFGLIGVPLGSILIVLVVSLPLNLKGIHRDTSVPVRQIVYSQIWWQGRLLVLAGAAALGSTYLNDAHFLPVMGKGAVALFGCVFLLGPLALKPPLEPYVRPRLRLLVERLRLSRIWSV